MKTNSPAKKMPRQKGLMKRVIKSVFRCYPKMLTIALICIVFNAVVSSLPSLFMQTVFGALKDAVAAQQTWGEAWKSITIPMLTLIGLYVLSLITAGVNKQLMAILTQGYLSKMREHMFDGMQDLPVRYFDTHNHGDVMSYYTNDIDALRQMVAESLPQLLSSAIMVLTLFVIMLYYSLWLTLIVLGGILLVFFVTKIVGGGAAKYFVGQQRAMAKTEGFVEEMMNGQKVVKVFCHEAESKRDFDKVNDHLYDQTNRANRYANMLMPILGNIGHVFYVVITLVGAMFILGKVTNVSISGSVFYTIEDGAVIASAGIVLLVAFLQTTRQFFNNINQVSQQVNSVVMGMAVTLRSSMRMRTKTA